MLVQLQMMTTLSMQNLKKNNLKLKVILILCVAVLAVMLGLLYVYTTTEKRENNVVESKDKTVEVKKEIQPTGYVVMKYASPIYQKDDDTFKIVGMVSKETLVLLDEKNAIDDTYYQIKDSAYYVSYRNIKKSNAQQSFDQSFKRYLPFNENVRTKTMTKLYDEDGNLRYALAQGIDLPILKKQGSLVYVRFSDELLALKKEEVEVYSNQNSQQANASKIPVFMYHFFYDAKANEQGRDGNFVEIDTFKQQMQYAKDNGYQSITMKELDMYLEGMIQLPERSFVVTMDDNAESVKRLAYPVLEALQIHATNFVITSWSDDFGALQSDYVELQSHSDAMHKGGCPGMQHGGLFNCIPFADGKKDVITSRDKLNGAFVFCYPFGDVNETMKQVLQEGGYRLAFTTKFGYVTIGSDKLELPRVRISKSTTVQAFARLLEG